MRLQTGIWTLILMICASSISIAMTPEDVKIHGFISQGYLLTDTNNHLADTEDGSFQFNELGINFATQLTDELRIGVQLFSRDLGTVGNNKIELDWANAVYRWRDWLGIQVGLMKMAHGLYNDIRDMDMLRTFVFLPESIYIEISRDYYTRMWGGELFGNIPMNQFGSLSYRFLVGTYSPDADNSGGNKFVELYIPFEVMDYQNGTQYNIGLQWYTPIKGLKLGFTSWRQNDLKILVQNQNPLGPDIPAGLTWDFEVENTDTTLSMEYTWNDLILAAEYRTNEIRTQLVNLAPESKLELEGYYGSATYRLNHWLEVGVYYSELYPDKNDKDGHRFISEDQPDHRAWRKDFCAAVRFDINDFTTLKVEGHRYNGTALLFMNENPDGMEKDWFLFALKATFNF